MSKTLSLRILPSVKIHDPDARAELAARNNMIKRIRNRLWLELRPMSKRSILSTLWGHRDLRKLYRESSHERFIELALDDYVGASYFEDLGKLSTYCYFKLQAQHDEDHGPLLKMQDRIRRVVDDAGLRACPMPPAAFRSRCVEKSERQVTIYSIERQAPPQHGA